MMRMWIIGIIIAACLAAAIISRLYLALQKETESNAGESIGIGQTTGSKEIQADKAQAVESSAGVMAVLADGIGSRNTGRVCAQVAADTILDRYEPYEVLHNPDYFFKTAFYEANKRIQATIGERRGGASLGAVFLNDTHLYYALAGDVRIALLRNEEIIPLSKGQTWNVLAVDAWRNGKITRQDALWSLEEERLWNYLGMDGFKEIETCTPPIELKDNDIVLMASKGIFEEVSWGEIEDILIKPLPVQNLADELIKAADMKADSDKENGSVILLKVRK